MVFALVLRDAKPVLEFVGFGVRHPPRGSRAASVYVLAHYRVHGTWPPR